MFVLRYIATCYAGTWVREYVGKKEEKNNDISLSRTFSIFEGKS